MGVTPPEISIVIPAYNEAARLPSYLKEVQAYFEGRDESYEVIVVDDGSQDGTADRVREVAAGRTAVTVHALDRNRGKGHAVRAGMARFSTRSATPAGTRATPTKPQPSSWPSRNTSPMPASATTHPRPAYATRTRDGSATNHPRFVASAYS